MIATRIRHRSSASLCHRGGMNTFSGSPVDRAGARRTDSEWVAERVADPRSRALLVTTGGVVVADDRLARVPLDGGDPILLGVEDDGRGLFAVDLGDAEPPPGTTAGRPAGAARVP